MRRDRSRLWDIGGSMAKVTREHAEMVEAKKATVAEIAKLAGVSRQAAYQMLKKYAEEKKKNGGDLR